MIRVKITQAASGVCVCVCDCIPSVCSERNVAECEDGDRFGTAGF